MIPLDPPDAAEYSLQRIVSVLEEIRDAITAVKPRLPEPWCDTTCPRQQTHTWSDCKCGGARLEFEALKGERDDG